MSNILNESRDTNEEMKADFQIENINIPEDESLAFVEDIKNDLNGSLITTKSDYLRLIHLAKLRNSCDVIIDTENGIPFFTPLYSRKPKICLVHHIHKLFVR